jgi:hypothetical protein
MKTITRTSVMNYWTRQLNAGKETYKDDCGEKDYTKMGEDAAEHFGVLSENGETEIEQEIFAWATEINF